MSDLLAALRREHHELTCTAEECRGGDEFLPAVIAEELAADVERQIVALEAELEVAA